MRNSTASLFNAVDRDRQGLAIVWYSDFAEREWWLDEVESLVPVSSKTARVSTVDDALAAPHSVALLAPALESEAEAVLTLNACREQLRARTQPLVFFLLRGGSGERELGLHAPSLWSWAAGNKVDPEAIDDVDTSPDRAAFAETHGETPEAWLTRWRQTGQPTDTRSVTIAFRAMALEQP